MSSLKDKVIIITGGSSGIGAETAVYLSQFQPKLVITARNKDRLDSVGDQCVKSGLPESHLLKVIADLRKDADIRALVDKAVETFHKIDVLVNNAGAGYIADTKSTDMEKYDDLMKINLRAPFYLTQQCIPHLTKTQGTIINVSTNLSQNGLPFLMAYCMSKAALDLFTSTLAKELAPQRIRVNSVNPGFVHTPFHATEGMPPEMEKALSEAMKTKCALGRAGESDDIAKVIKFLASDDSAYMTGQIVIVDGGYNVMAGMVEQH